MSKYIKDFDVLELYHLDPNGKSFEAAKIINVSTCMEEIRSNNKDNVDHRNPYDENRNNKSTEVNMMKGK